MRLVRRADTIRVGEPVMVIETGEKGVCTSRPGTKYFVNFGKDKKGDSFTRDQLVKIEEDKSQINLFEAITEDHLD